MNKLLDEQANEYENLIKSLSRAAGDQLKILLEQKHIYQHVMIDAKKIIADWAARLGSSGWGKPFNRLEFDNERFIISENQFLRVERGSRPEPVLTLIVGNVKLFCSGCDEREVFRPVWYVDLNNTVAAAEFSIPESVSGFQLFTIAL